MKIDGNQIKIGNILEINNKLWRVIKTQHTQPGKGGAYLQAEMKDIKDGTKMNERFRSSESVERAILDEKECQFLYFDSNKYKNLQEGDTENDGGKERYIKKIFKGFKDKAYYEMLKEYPEVKDAIKAALKEKSGLLKRKKGDKTEEINVLLPQ